MHRRDFTPTGGRQARRSLKARSAVEETCAVSAANRRSHIDLPDENGQYQTVGIVNGGDNWLRTAGEGKYARLERARRFLVCGAPALIGWPRRIEDRYLYGTRLRLRRMQVGDDVVCKLTQKVRRDEGDPADIAVTNTYLSPDEYARLWALRGHVLKKTRHMSSFAGGMSPLFSRRNPSGTQCPAGGPSRYPPASNGVHGPKDRIKSLVAAAA